MDWMCYKPVFEDVPAEDGGGYRIFYPTLGYAVYGVGDSYSEVYSSFERSKRAFESYLATHPEYKLPEPTLDDLRYEVSMKGNKPVVANNNYAYAA